MKVACPQCGRRSLGSPALCAYCGTRLPAVAPRRPNADARRALQAADLATFVKQTGRRAQKSGEPNDRQIDREVEARMKRMSPVELDRLLREDE